MRFRMKIAFIKCSKTNETDATDPQEFLFTKNLISDFFFLSTSNHEMLLIFGSLFFFIFLDTLLFSLTLNQSKGFATFLTTFPLLPVS